MALGTKEEMFFFIDFLTPHAALFRLADLGLSEPESGNRSRKVSFIVCPPSIQKRLTLHGLVEVIDETALVELFDGENLFCRFEVNDKFKLRRASAGGAVVSRIAVNNQKGDFEIIFLPPIFFRTLLSNHLIRPL